MSVQPVSAQLPPTDGSASRAPVQAVRTRASRRHYALAIAQLALVVGVVIGVTALAVQLRAHLIGGPGFFLYIPLIAALAYAAGRDVGYGAALLSMIATWYLLVPHDASWPALRDALPTLGAFGIAALGAAEGFARAHEAERRRRAAAGAQAHLAAIAASSDDAIFSTSMEGVILSWNRGAERVYGYTPGEAVGRPVAMLTPAGRTDEIPRGLARLREGDVITPLETVRMRKDGTQVEVSLTISPIKDERGRIIATSMIEHDISRRARLGRRQRLLVDLSAALSEAVTPGQVARAVVGRAMSALGASAAAVWLVAQDGTFELIASMGYTEEFADRWRRVAPGQDRHLEEAVRTGTVVWHDIAPAEDHPRADPPAGREGGGATVPLRLHSPATGVLSLRAAGLSRADGGEAEFLLALGRQCAQAFERARLYANEHQMAATLQRALLPTEVPDVPGVRLRAVYVPSEGAPAVGGDWYDVFRLPDGRVALAIGDVVGRGVEAAVVMGQVRQAVRAAALEGHPPAEVLAIASQVLKLSHEHEGMTTAIFGTFDPVKGVFAYATAGHPAPILAEPDGARALPSGGLPLGFMEAAAAPSWTADLAPGSLLVLITDGLIESTRDPAGGHEALLETVAREARDRSPDAARAILARMVGTAAPDDVAIVTLAVDPQPVDHLDLTLPAQPSSLRLIRHALRQLSRGLDLDEDVVSALMIASGEAANNVIEHAYGASPGMVFLRVQREDGAVRVEIRDRGTWRPGRAHTDGGRGLDLIRALADDVQVVPGPGGTTVTFSLPLRPRAAPPPAPAPPSIKPAAAPVRRVAVARESGRLEVDWDHWQIRRVDDVPVLEVSGDVDLDNAGRFKTLLQEAAEQALGGTVVLALSEARYFDSQGFRTLLQVARRLRTIRCMLVLVLPPDARLRPVFTAMGVSSMLPVFDSLRDAITAARVREG